MLPGRSRLNRESQEFCQNRKDLSEPPLKLERAVEMVLHAYNYVRSVDADGESGAAALLWSTYQKLRLK